MSLRPVLPLSKDTSRHDVSVHFPLTLNAVRVGRGRLKCDTKLIDPVCHPMTPRALSSLSFTQSRCHPTTVWLSYLRGPACHPTSLSLSKSLSQSLKLSSLFIWHCLMVDGEGKREDGGMVLDHLSVQAHGAVVVVKLPKIVIEGKEEDEGEGEGKPGARAGEGSGRR